MTNLCPKIEFLEVQILADKLAWLAVIYVVHRGQWMGETKSRACEAQCEEAATRVTEVEGVPPLTQYPPLYRRCCDICCTTVRYCKVSLGMPPSSPLVPS